MLAALLLLIASHAAHAVSFQPPVTYPKHGAGGLVAADLDGDGNPDIAVNGIGSVSLFYGNGDGTFAPRVDLLIEGVSGIEVGDVNGDGRSDLLLAQGNFLQVLLSQGGRSYAPEVSYIIGAGPSGIIARDFNGDGRLDVAVTKVDSDRMGVLLNLGDGTFGPATFYPANRIPAGITAGDFNGDGKLDLAVANILGYNLRVYLGQGDGTFTVGADYAVGSYCGQVVAADLNGDGKLDLAACNWMDHTVSLLFGNGTGQFPTRVDYPGNTYPGVIDAVDVEGDGDKDLVWADGGSNYFSVMVNKGNGIFFLPTRFLSGGSDSRTMAVADFDRDGLPDVATGNGGSGSVGVALNVSDTFVNGPRGHVMASMPIQNPDNGHWYQVINLFDAIPWSDARNGAALWRYNGLPGHLVTLTSEAERRFVVNTIFPTAPTTGRFWIGAYQDRSAPDYLEPAGGWRWVTGEPFQFTDWLPGEPNNGGDEDVIEMHWNGLANDLHDFVSQGAYVVEYEPTAAPGVAQVVIVPSTVEGGQTASGEVTLTRPAGPGGDVVTLESSDPSGAVAPATVRVPEGNTTARFTLTSFPVGDPKAVTISAGFSGSTTGALLHVLPVQPPLPDGHQRVSLPVFNPANGHWYQAIRVPSGITWPAADAAARQLSFVGLPGHLLTLASADESQFISSRILVGLPGNQRCWFGLFQDVNAPTFSEPHGGWRWVTGEPVSYANWIGGEPNGAGEEHAHLQRERGDQWNDVTGHEPHDVYLVEYEAPQLAAASPLTVSPNPVVGGQGATGQVTLALPAGPGGVTVGLFSSDRTRALVAEAVTVPEGATSVTFPIATSAVAGGAAVDIGAARINQASVTLQLLPLAPPSALAAESVSDTEIDLSWTDNSDNETGFEIQRKAGGDWSTVAEAGPNTSQFSDSGLVPFAAYTYRVRALSGGAASAWSAEASASAGVAPVLLLSQPALDFGSVPVGTMGDVRTLTVTNGGTSPLSISGISIGGEAAADFGINAGGEAGALGPGESRTLTLFFRPAVSGSCVAHLVLRSDAGSAVKTVGLTGTGVRRSVSMLAFTPASLDFGPEPVGLSGTLVVLLHNTGDVPVNLGSIFLQGSQAAEFTLPMGSCSGTALQPGAICLLNVRFSPTRTGTRSATLVIPNDALLGTLFIPLTGVGTAPLLRLNTDSLNFTVPVAGGSSVAQTVVFTNQGDAPLVIEGLELVGTNASSFQIVSDSGEESLDPGASRTVRVVFSSVRISSIGRRARIAGARIASVSYNAALQIRHNDTRPDSPQQIQLTAVQSAPTAPTAPASLKAVANAASPGQVELTWQDTSANEAEFVLLRRTGAGLYGRITVLPPNTTSFTDRTASSSTPYTYIMRAVNTVGVSAWSNEASVITPALLPPAAPTPLRATMVSATRVELTWTDRSSSEKEFVLLRKSGNGVYARVAVLGPNTTSYTDATVRPENSYTYIMRAVNGGGASPWTNEPSVTTPDGMPLAPTPLRATMVSPTRVELAWTDRNAEETGFVLLRKTGSGLYQRLAVLPANTTAYTDTSAAPNTSYTYIMRATNDRGVSPWTNEPSVTTPSGLPAKPTNVQAVAVSATRVNLTWTDTSSNEQQFVLLRKVGAGLYQRIGVVGANTTSFTDTTVSGGTTYTYILRAVNEFGVSAWSDEPSVTTP